MIRDEYLRNVNASLFTFVILGCQHLLYYSILTGLLLDHPIYASLSIIIETTNQLRFRVCRFLFFNTSSKLRYSISCCFINYLGTRGIGMQGVELDLERRWNLRWWNNLWRYLVMTGWFSPGLHGIWRLWVFICIMEMQAGSRKENAEMVTTSE